MSNAKKMLTKEEILNANDLPIREVDVPDWNGIVRLRTLPGSERDVFENIVQKRKKGQDIELKGLKVLLLSLAIVNGENKLMFSEEDLDGLNSKSSRALNKLFDVATEMNGIGEEAVEELRKNLPAVPSGGNGSG